LVNTPDIPITNLPSFDLTWNEQTGKYEGTYGGFTVVGIYTITVYAMNEETILSLPKTTTVEQILSGASIILQSPLDGASFGACSLSTPPIFSWTSGQDLKGYEVQFSLDQGFSLIPVRIMATARQVVATSGTWKKVLMMPGGSPAAVHWRVMGRKADGSTVFSEVRSFGVDLAEAVGIPMISPTSQRSLPILSWENNCATKFKVRFGSDGDFTKKVSYSFIVKNPNDNGGVLDKGLNSAQWKEIRKLVNEVTGSTIFWYVESWDGIGRYAKTDVMNFVLTN
jgi:hypothetical protein